MLSVELLWRNKFSMTALNVILNLFEDLKNEKDSEPSSE